MAYIRTEYCRTCEEHTNHINLKCSKCEERKRRTELAAWQAQTVEEKLLDIHKRLQRLERGPQLY